jgi:hypothetical protein
MSKTKPRKLVVFSIGGKGGVGKSWLIALLIDWYRARKVPFHALDLDNENNTLSRFYPDAEFIEVSSERDLDAMIEKIVESETALTVIDMRAASTDRIAPWWKQVDFDSLQGEHGVRFTAIGVVDSSADSVANIGFWSKDVLHGNPDIRFVIAQNKVRGAELSYLDSPARAEYQKTLDLAEIEIPKLDEWVHQKLEVGDLRVSAALEVEDPNSPLTRFMTRSRLKKYQQAMFEEFDKIKDRLLP